MVTEIGRKKGPASVNRRAFLPARLGTGSKPWRVDSGASQSPPTWRIGMTAPATSTECWGRFSFRLLDAPFAMLDGWIAKQREPDLTRPEAIRRLVELGLKVK